MATGAVIHGKRVGERNELLPKLGFPGGASGKEPPANAGDTRDANSIPGSGRSPGGGDGNPLQDSCLENPMDRGVWWATVHRVAKSRTWLKWLSTHACSQKSVRKFPPPSSSCQGGSKKEEDCGGSKAGVPPCHRRPSTAPPSALDNPGLLRREHTPDPPKDLLKHSFWSWPWGFWFSRFGVRPKNLHF